MPALKKTMQSSTASTSAHGPPSTAQVLEYVCLFTPDLKRKQKRWQDGRLKFHSFNKRIMVYDERGNFIGDTHWREDYDFGDGEEVQLERGGVIVQTSEHVASHSQDLSELIDKRVQEKELRQSAAASRQPRPTPSGGMPVRPPPTSSHFQLRHTPLLSLLGTPTGHHGRASVPTESPFEERRMVTALASSEQQEESPRPSKRRRREPSPPSKNGYAQSLFGATLTLSGRPMSSAPIRHETSSQGFRHDHIPPASSDISNKIGADDEEHLRETSPPMRAGRQGENPLTERPATATNIPGTQSERSLVGKDARTKANVPSLLRVRPQRNSASVTLPEHGEPRSVRTRRANRISKSEDGTESVSQPKAKNTKPVQITPSASLTRDIASPDTLDRGGTLSNSKQSTSDRPVPNTKAALDYFTVERPQTKVHTTKKVAKGQSGPVSASASLIEEDSTIHASTSASLQSIPSSRLNDEAAVEKATVRGPRMELRMAPSKKRGLLVLSEKSNMKKVKKSRKPEKHLESGHSRSSQAVTISTNHNVSHRADIGISHDVVARSISEENVLSQNSPHHGVDTAILTESCTPENSINAAEKKGTTIPPLSFYKRTKGDGISQKVDLMEDTNHAPRAEITTQGDQPLRRNITAPKAVSSTSQDKDEQEHYFDESHEPSAEQRAKQRGRQPSVIHGQDQKQSRTEAQPNVATQPLNIIDAGEESIDSHKGELFDDPKTLPEEKTDYGKDFDEIYSRRPDNAPPPRLAQFSRKSVRSREVIGLFYEDNNAPSLQPKPTTRSLQRNASIALPTPVLTERSLNKVNNLEQPSHANERAPTETSLLLGHNMIPNGQQPDPAAQQVRPAQKQTDTMLSMVEEPMDPEQQQIPVPPTITNVLAEPDLMSVGKQKAPSATPRVGVNDVALKRTGLSSGTVALSGPGKDYDSSSSILEIPSGGVIGHQRAMPTRSGDAMSLDDRVSVPDVQRAAMSTLVVSRKTRPRIGNPATRGKKAANPSDASGHVLERVLPLGDHPVGRPVIATQPPVSGLPGFSKANGGPWSREAHDLFEYKRPC